MLQGIAVAVPRAIAKFTLSANAMASAVQAAYKQSLTAVQHLSNAVVAINGELPSAAIEVSHGVLLRGLTCRVCVVAILVGRLDVGDNLVMDKAAVNTR
jgi:hypothetical protein